jgi:hypothetical protein
MSLAYLDLVVADLAVTQSWALAAAKISNCGRACAQMSTLAAAPNRTAPKIFPDLRPGASSTPCSHHLIPCQKYREFRPGPIDSAALYVVKLSEKSHFLGKSLLFSLIAGIFGVADRFPKTTYTTSLTREPWRRGWRLPSVCPRDDGALQEEFHHGRPDLFSRT